MNQKLVLGSGAATMALMVSFSCTKEKTARPNIILIVLDDQGYGDLSCYPNTRPVDTPHIDQIASEGALFTNGYANHHGCAPSRAALLTGRYQQRIGFYDIWEVQKGLPAGQKLIGDWLRQAGYATALIGKWHLGEKDYNHPLEMGFDRFFGFPGGMHDYYDSFIGDTWEGGASGYAPIYDQHNIVNSIDYLTNEFTRQTIRFIDQNKSGPFFIYLSYNAPHGPFQAPQVYLDKYPDESGTYRKIRAMTRVLDEDIGKIMSHLQKRKIDRNTLVVYVSDNGGTRAHHNWIDQMPPSLVGPDEWTPNGNGWYYYYDRNTRERLPLNGI